MLSPGPGEQGGNELTAAADTELDERRGQVFLDGVGRDVQLPDDPLRGVSPDDEGDHTGLRAGQTVGAEQQRADLHGGHRFDHDGDLRGGCTAQAGGVQGKLFSRTSCPRSKRPQPPSRSCSSLMAWRALWSWHGETL